MPQRDLYQEATELAVSLVEEGYGEWSRRIERSLSAGATATEILMALRWDLSQLRASGLVMSASNTERLRTLLDGLECILSTG